MKYETKILIFELFAIGMAMLFITILMITTTPAKVNPNCERFYGTGSSKNPSLFFEGNKTEMKDFGKYTLSLYRKTYPYKKYSFNGYWEKEVGACNITYKRKDVIFSFQYMSAMGQGGWWYYNGLNVGSVAINKLESNKKNEFIILHESGHAYGLAHDEDYGITGNFSIMARRGGDYWTCKFPHKYRDWQEKEILKVLGAK